MSACIFDWGGTLTPWHTIDPVDAWRAALAVAAAEGGLDEDRVGALVDTIAAAEDAAWARSRDHHRSATLAGVLAESGVDASPELLAAYHEWWTPHTYTDPDVPGLFAGLHERGIRVGVLSNTIWPREVHEAILRRDGVLDLVDGDVYTSEIPWTKPHPEAFRAALAAVGVDHPADAVFVGDRPFDDIHGATSVGMRAVLVPHSTIPAHQVGVVPDGFNPPSAVVQRLSDLLPLVDAWDGR